MSLCNQTRRGLAGSIVTACCEQRVAKEETVRCACGCAAWIHAISQCDLVVGCECCRDSMITNHATSLDSGEKYCALCMEQCVEIEAEEGNKQNAA